MRATFATQGIMDTLVTNSVTVFTSSEFPQFSKQNGIQYVTTYNASNGLVEWAVKAFKEGIKKDHLKKTIEIVVQAPSSQQLEYHLQNLRLTTSQITAGFDVPP